LSYTATTTGIYTVVNTENGCSSAISDPIAVSANATPAPPLVKVVGSNIACEGETVKLITSTQSKNLWYRNGILVKEATGYIFEASTTGDYYVQSDDVSNCISSSSNIVNIYFSNRVNLLPLIGPTQICEGLTGSFKSKFAGGDWSSSKPNVASIDNKGNIIAKAGGKTTITYSLTNTFGCKATSSAELIVNTAASIDSIVGSPQLCLGSTVQLTNTNPTGLWETSNTSSSTINQAGLLSTKTPGLVTINYTVTNGKGCVAKTSYPITINPLPSVTASSSSSRISKGLFVTLTATGLGNFTWTPSKYIVDSTKAITRARVVEKTLYTVSLTDSKGCINSATTQVDIIEDFFIEPVIVMTPNGDGMNDLFVINNLDQYPNNRLQVFDRTGKLLYESLNYNNKWDGSVNGKLLTKDTYLYVLSIQGQVIKKGTISIIR